MILILRISLLWNRRLEVFYKNTTLKISQRNHICPLTGSLQLFWKRDSNTEFFNNFFEIFPKNLLAEHLRGLPLFVATQRTLLVLRWGFQGLFHICSYCFKLTNYCKSVIRNGTGLSGTQFYRCHIAKRHADFEIGNRSMQYLFILAQALSMFCSIVGRQVYLLIYIFSFIYLIHF